MKALGTWMVLSSIGLIFLFLAFLMIMDGVGALHGDHSNWTISGPASLDSASVPYWVHLPHLFSEYVFKIAGSLFAVGLLFSLRDAPPKPTDKA